jgi:hypothetical protein
LRRGPAIVALVSAIAAAPAARADDALMWPPPACFPLFHACETTEECCPPYQCINVNTRACQLEGPPPDGGF